MKCLAGTSLGDSAMYYRVHFSISLREAMRPFKAMFSIIFGRLPESRTPHQVKKEKQNTSNFTMHRRDCLFVPQHSVHNATKNLHRLCLSSLHCLPGKSRTEWWSFLSCCHDALLSKRRVEMTIFCTFIQGMHRDSASNQSDLMSTAENNCWCNVAWPVVNNDVEGSLCLWEASSEIQKLQEDGTFHEPSTIYNLFDIMHLKRTCKIKSLVWCSSCAGHVKCCVKCFC